MGSLLVYTALLTLVGWTFAGLLVAWPEKSIFGDLPTALVAVGFLLLPFVLWETYGQSLLMGLDLAKHFNRATMMGRTVNLVAVYAFVGWLSLGPVGALGAALLAGIVTAAGGAGALLKQAGYRLAPRSVCIFTLAKGAVRLHLNAIGTYLFAQSGVLVVNHFHGAAATGNYQLAAQLISVMMIIPNAVSQTMYGVVTTKGPDAAWPVNRHVLHRAMGITAISVATAWLLAPLLNTSGSWKRLRGCSRPVSNHAADAVRWHAVCVDGCAMDRPGLILAGVTAYTVRRHLWFWCESCADPLDGGEWCHLCIPICIWHWRDLQLNALRILHKAFAKPEK